MTNADWWRALTTRDWQPGLAAPEPLFFGGWTDARLRRDVLDHLQVDHRAELLSLQRRSCKTLPDDVSQADIFIMPSLLFGMMVAIGTDGSARDGPRHQRVLHWGATSTFGVEHRFRIDKALLDPANDALGWLTGTLKLRSGKAMPLTFYDPLFALNRSRYAAGQEGTFLLHGVVLDAVLTDSDPVWYAGGNLLSNQYSFVAEILKTEAPLIGMAADDCILGARVTRALARLSDDFELHLYLTDRLGASLPPLAHGDRLRGVARIAGVLAD